MDTRNQLAAVEAANVTLDTENAQLRQALRAIRKGLSEDADGEFWPARRWLHARKIYHGDLSGNRVLELVAKHALHGKLDDEPLAAFTPAEPPPLSWDDRCQCSHARRHHDNGLQCQGCECVQFSQAPAEPQTPEPHRYIGGLGERCQVCGAGPHTEVLAPEAPPDAPNWQCPICQGWNWPTDQTCRFSHAGIAEAPPAKTCAQCVCHVDDGLVREWVMKARAVAFSKGFAIAPLSPRDERKDTDAQVDTDGAPGSCAVVDTAGPASLTAEALEALLKEAHHRLTICRRLDEVAQADCPAIANLSNALRALSANLSSLLAQREKEQGAGPTQEELRQAIAWAIGEDQSMGAGVRARATFAWWRDEILKIGRAPVPLSEASGSAGRSEAQSSNSQSVNALRAEAQREAFALVEQEARRRAEASDHHPVFIELTDIADFCRHQREEKAK